MRWLTDWIRRARTLEQIHDRPEPADVRAARELYCPQPDRRPDRDDNREGA